MLVFPDHLSKLRCNHLQLQPSSTPPKKADNTVPSKASPRCCNSMARCKGWDHGEIHHCQSQQSERFREQKFPNLAEKQLFIPKTKNGRPKCHHAHYLDGWSAHISGIRYRDPPWMGWPCPTESRVPCQWWPLRYLNDPFFVKAAFGHRFQPGKTMMFKKKNESCIFNGWGGDRGVELHSFGGVSKPCDSIRWRFMDQPEPCSAFNFPSNHFECQSFWSMPTIA